MRDPLQETVRVVVTMLQANINALQKNNSQKVLDDLRDCVARLVEFVPADKRLESRILS